MSKSLPEVQRTASGSGLYNLSADVKAELGRRISATLQAKKRKHERALAVMARIDSGELTLIDAKTKKPVAIPAQA